MTIQEIEPSLAKQWVESGQALIVDVRDGDERSAERIDASLHVPLAQVARASITPKPGQKVIFHCKSGRRSAEACSSWTGHSGESGFSMKGGIEAWKMSGFRIETANVPISITRQVQISAGSLVLVGTVLGATVSSNFLWLSGIVGAGLIFAGASGTCGMAALLSILPWNRVFRVAKIS